MFAMVAPIAVDASAAVTSEHASTLSNTLALGVGVGDGLGDDPEDVLDDPQAKSAIRAPATIATRTRLTLGVSQADDPVSRINSS